MMEEVDGQRSLSPSLKPALGGETPSRTCSPTERGHHTKAGLLAGPVTPWNTDPGKTVQGIHAETLCEELQLVGRTHDEKVGEGLSPVGETDAGIGQECEEASP